MVAVYPASLPTAAILGSFNETPFDNVVKFGPSKGPPMTRRGSTAAGFDTVMTKHMTVAQRTTFDTFYEDTILHGALKFSMAHPDPEDGGTYNWLFEEEPRFRKAGKDYYVDFHLRRFP